MGTVERITTAMAELMRRQGYAATGIAELARAAGVPNGSVYHHFRGGKRDVAARALRESGAAYGQLLPTLLEPYDDLATGIEAAFAEAGRTMAESGWMAMCPVATVTAEIADVEPELRAVGADVMTGWVEGGAAFLRGRGLGDDDAREVVHAVLAALEGAFVVARGLRSREPLDAAGRALGAWVATLPVGVPAP
ncbi:TetR/AcrR family transcriptional regulator [Actinomycetospora endophytica]|uniref:TetR/AcrR family transcriptional regulator n=1 Tax=Actinomycetospora endophytica TaxID=2291215 RepID=A0ABS8P9T3_9PSEU|nr:TetR/AcrR family transcriptional regulator [Actinomycetospora endophytica]MCD2194285.1 TetR/AcrR family transcriptional regulator [Actinomycetospora endophytica]